MEKHKQSLINFAVDHFYDDQYGSFMFQTDAEGRPLNTGKGPRPMASAALSMYETYRLTGNADYRSKYAQSVIDFLINHNFDPEHGGFYFSCYRDGTVAEDTKMADQLAYAAWAFFKAYHETGDSRLIQYGLSAVNFIRDHLHDAEYGGFYDATDRTGSSLVHGDAKMTLNQLWCADAFIEAYKVTGNTEYLDVYAKSALDVVMAHLYHSSVGGFFWYQRRDYSYGNPDKLAYVNATGILTMLKAYDVTLDYAYRRAVDETVNFLLKNMYDPDYGGFYERVDLYGGMRDDTKKFNSHCALAYAFHRAGSKKGSKLAVDFLHDHLYDPDYGGFFNLCDRMGDVTDSNKYLEDAHYYVLMPLEAAPPSLIPIGAAIAGAVIGGVAGYVFQPVGKVVSTLIGAGLGAGLGYGVGCLATPAGASSCPVCGVEVEEKPLGVDVKCKNCGFVSAWTRH